MKDTGGLIFPWQMQQGYFLDPRTNQNEPYYVPVPGSLTLRGYFAGLVMPYLVPVHNADGAARHAVAYADALIEELKKGG